MMPVNRDRLLDRIVRRFGIPALHDRPQNDGGRSMPLTGLDADRLRGRQPKAATDPRKPGNKVSS